MEKLPGQKWKGSVGSTYFSKSRPHIHSLISRPPARTNENKNDLPVGVCWRPHSPNLRYVYIYTHLKTWTGMMGCILVVCMSQVLACKCSTPLIQFASL